MKYEDAPKGFTAAYKAYMQRVQNNVSQAITQSNSIPVLDKMPLKPTPGYVYSFTRALSPEIPKPGIYVWSGSGWIGNMDEQQWGNDRISDVSFSKITAGMLGVEQLVLANNAGSNIRSANYSPGSAGFAIAGNGSCEFQNALIRGTLYAQDLLYGTIASGRFGNNTIGSGPVISGALHNRYALSSQNNTVPYIGSTTIDLANCLVVGPVTLPANSDRTGVCILVNAFFQWNSTNAPGWLVAGVMTGYRSGSLLARYMYYENGRDVLSFMALHNSSTSSQTYYLGLQQYISNPYSVNCFYDMAVLEFVK